MGYSNFSIRRIQRQNEIDVDALNAFWHTAEGADKTLADYDARSVKNYIQDPANIMLIAYTDEQKPVGVVLATVIKKPYMDSDFLYVDEVDVHPNYRQQGVAKALMTELIKIAREMYLDEVWVGTEPNNKAANALYVSVSGAVKESHVGYTYKLS